MAKSNLIKLAKGSDKKEKVVKKPVEKKVKEVPLTPEQERDLKAKAKVDELLQGVDLTLKKPDEELLEMEAPEGSKDVEWLEEQLGILSDENARLKGELEVAKGDYGKLFAEFQKVKQGGQNEVMLVNPESDGAVKESVIKLFNEIQANHISMGRNFVIVPPAFLNRLIVFFPFLQDLKRF
jgi:hypothetical protein